MQLVISEKPSVAMALAKALGVTEKKKGWIEGNGYIISWCVGHLVGLANADAYNERYKKWNLDDLPIIPETWKFVVSKDKNEQFSILKELMNDSRVTEAVNACDAGREGELIFRLVYDKAGCRKPVKRLWISSMEEKSIREGFANLKEGGEYENLYQSALCRAQADWIVGINATRLFSRLYNRTLNVGRVQTPTLAMISERENSIRNFKKEKYFNVHLKSGDVDAVLEKVKTAEEAEKICNICSGQTAEVTEIKTERKTVNPPKLYDLTTLQREANRLYSYTAQQTLDYAQSLYEMKLCTYPRTDSNYVDEDMCETVQYISELAVEITPDFDEYILIPDISRVVDSSKVTDHHAIIPTAEVGKIDFDSIPEGEKKILQLIINRLLCAASTPYVYETVTANISCGGYSFAARWKNVISEGFKFVENIFRKNNDFRDDSDDDVISVILSEGQLMENVAAEISEHFTQPPKHYTEDTLLSAMERAGTDEITEEVERSGLGTPATRAGVIEKLAKSGFIRRDKKNLLITESGTDLVSVIPDIVKSAKMTADWENNLSLVSQGKFTSQQFMADISKLTNDIIDTARNNVDNSKVTPSQFSSESVGKCPRCGKDVVITPKAYSCEDRNCGFAIWKNDRFFESARKPLTREIVEALLKNGKTEVRGLYSQKSKRNYDAIVCLDDTGKYVNFKLEFAPGKVKK